jgi:hypothetical protein
MRLLKARRRHLENLNEKLKLAGALNDVKKGTAAVLLQLWRRTDTHRNYQKNIVT